MKNFFSAIAYSFKRFWHRHDVGIMVIGIFLFIGIAFTIGYNWCWHEMQETNMPTEEKYLEYETIALQIFDGDMKNLQLPEKTTVKIEDGKITVSNTLTYYQVTGQIIGDKLTFTRDSGSVSRFGERFLVGFLSAVLAAGVIYIVAQIVTFIYKMVREFTDDYKEMKRKLAKKDIDH